MKTLDQVLESFSSNTLDCRDTARLAQFVPKDRLKELGLSLSDGAYHEVVEFTEENILKQLKMDVNFGFEKALNKRGISASLMHSVVSMQNDILENELQDFYAYAQYGLPLFKATALLYGFPNDIGDDTGTESKYSYEEY